MLQNARIEIIVIPVGKLKKESFQQYLDIIRKFDSIQEGTKKIYFEFLTEYSFDEILELEYQNQCFGVIGVINSGQIDDLAAAYKEFNTLCSRYPSSLVKRCFAFEPREDQNDDTKGIIMIPHVGDISFYISTMINDFAKDLIIQFGLLITSIERKSIIQGPILIAPPFNEVKDQVVEVFVNPEKTRRRTPFRIQKLLGDVHLLSGSLDQSLAW